MGEMICVACNLRCWCRDNLAQPLGFVVMRMIGELRVVGLGLVLCVCFGMDEEWAASMRVWCSCCSSSCCDGGNDMCCMQSEMVVSR